MVIRLSTARSVLWFSATLLVAFSFPLQVYAGNPYPSLLPYVLISLILILNVGFSTMATPQANVHYRHRNIDTLAKVYVFLVVFNTAWQAALGAVSPGEVGVTFVNFLLPVVWYYYFRRQGAEKEIRAVFLAVVIGGLVVGAYFAYDSYAKLALGHVTDYATRALQYSMGRSGAGGDAGSGMRATAGFRSYGLLESHSTSGAWVMLGAFAALAMLPESRRTARRVTVFVFASMLLLGLNFTAIIAFTAIIVLFEFGGLRILQGRFSASTVSSIGWLAFLVALMVAAASWIVGDAMMQFVLSSLSGQTDLALGTGGDQSILSITVANARRYPQHLLAFPMTLLLGDGFTTYGLVKGSDTGWVESLARFGVPFFLAVTLGYIRLVKASLRRIRLVSNGRSDREERLNQNNILAFAACVTLMVLITEAHYTVWTSKSVLPIVFFVLALFSRYLATPSRGTVSIRTGSPWDRTHVQRTASPPSAIASFTHRPITLTG